MPANAGTIEAQLILNASQFQKQMQAAMASAQGMGKTISNSLQAPIKSIGQATKSTQSMSQSLNQGKSHASAFGSAISSINNNINSYQTYTRAAAAQQATFSNNLKTSSSLFNGLGRQVNEATSSFSNMGNAYKTATTPITTTTSKISSALSSVGSTGSAAFSKVTSGIMTVGNALGSLTNSFVNFNVWMGAFVGYAFAQFTVGAAMATQESLSLFKFVGMGTDEVNRLNQATNNYAAAAAKVSQPELLSAWKLVRISQKMTGDQMIANQGVLGDTIALFKANGRTAEDAGRAIEDAMAGGADGIKRLKEIGITSMQELYDRGFDPSKPETFFQALKKVYDERGVTGYANKVTSLADRFENLKEKITLAGIAAGEVMMPAVETMVNAATGAFEGMGATVTGLGIAFGGLTIVLGLFWPTLVTIGSGFALVAGKMIAAAGATAVYGTAIKGAEGQTVGLLQSLKSIPLATAAAGAAFAAAVAVLIGVAYYIGQTASASAAWSKIESDHNKQTETFTQTTQNLNEKLTNQKTIRDQLLATGQNTTQINNDIAATEAAIASNTNAAAAAQERYNNAVTVKQGLEKLKDERTGTATSEGAGYVKSMIGLTDPALADTVGDPEYQAELEEIARAYNRVSGPALTYAGTMKRIAEGEDTYSKYWKENPKLLKEYNKQYGEYLLSNKRFNEAVEKQDIGGMIWYGVDSAFQQADVGIMEIQASFQSWWKDLSKGWEQSGKDAEASVNGIKQAFAGLPSWFGGLFSRLGELWGETTSYFQGAWNNTIVWFQSGLNWIGAGFSATAAWIQGAWSNTMAFFGNLANAVIGGVLGLWNTLAGAVGAGVHGLVSIGENGLSWAWNTVSSLWDMVSRGVSGVVSIVTSITGGPPMGLPNGPFSSSLKNIPSTFLNMASGFKYMGYGGIGQTISQTLSSGAGNCVDGSLAQISLAKMWGIPAELIQTTWMGNPHVYARIAGQDKDIANHALTGSWRAPPRGPRGSGGGNTYVFNAPVYDWKEFKKDVAKANDQIIREY